MSAYNSGVLTISGESLSYWPESLVNFRGGGAVNVPRATDRYALIGFQGCGVIEGRFVAHRSDLEASLSRWRDLDMVIHAVKDSAGSYTIQLWDSVSGSYIILNDPLGAGHIFKFQSAGVTAFGVEPEQIARALRADYGITIRRDLRYFAGVALTATAVYGAPSPYVGVSPLEAGVGVEVTPDGRAVEIHYFHGRRPFHQETYEASIDRICDEIVRNCDAAAAYDAEFLVTHLTGGFDSRLVLAGLRAAGRSARSWYNNFTPDNDDDRIARALCGMFNLKFTRWWGKTATNPSDSLPWGLGGAMRSGGAIPSGLPAKMAPTSAVVLQGGYGECFRTYNRLDLRVIDRDAATIAYELWRWAAFPSREERGNSMFAATFLDEVANLLGSRLHAITESGVAYEHALSELFLLYRNRYFMGQQAWYGSSISHRFDPLYTVYGARIAEDHPFDERRANFFGIDIMRRLDPELIAYPFDRDMVSDWYMRRRGAVERRDFGSTQAEILPGPDTSTRPTPAPSYRPAAVAPARAFADSTVDDQVARVREVAEEISPVYDVERLVAILRDELPEADKLRASAMRSLALAELL